MVPGGWVDLRRFNRAGEDSLNKILQRSIGAFQETVYDRVIRWGSFEAHSLGFHFVMRQIYH